MYTEVFTEHHLFTEKCIFDLKFIHDIIKHLIIRQSVGITLSLPSSRASLGGWPREGGWVGGVGVVVSRCAKLVREILIIVKAAAAIKASPSLSVPFPSPTSPPTTPASRSLRHVGRQEVAGSRRLRCCIWFITRDWGSSREDRKDLTMISGG